MEKILSTIVSFCSTITKKENLHPSYLHCLGPPDLVTKGNTLSIVVKAAVKELKQQSSSSQMLLVVSLSPSNDAQDSDSSSLAAPPRSRSCSPPVDRPHTRPGGLAGLYNFGNVCFALSVLQSLSHCISFRQYFEALPLDTHETAWVALKTLLAKMWSGETDVVNPSTFLHILERSLAYSFGQEDDAHWFLQALLQLLDEELSTVNVGSLGTVSELFLTEKTQRSKCRQCHRWTSVLSTSLAPTVPFANPCTVLDCLHSWSQEGSGPPHCSFCKSDNLTRGVAQLTHLPSILVVHWERSRWTGKVIARPTRSGAAAKDSRQVSFPFELDVKSLVGKAITNTSYELSSIIVHEGLTPASGHYVAVVQQNGGWQKLNDAFAPQLIPEKYVRRLNPSLLFYRRLDCT